jgi:hypothetical protein
LKGSFHIECRMEFSESEESEGFGESKGILNEQPMPVSFEPSRNLFDQTMIDALFDAIRPGRNEPRHRDKPIVPIFAGNPG